MADIAAKGSTVEIAADDDQMYDFYLLKVTSEGVKELEEDYTDDYKFTALWGTQVLKGHFYTTYMTSLSHLMKTALQLCMRPL